MHILIDGIVYSNAPSGGVYQYFNELLPRLGKSGQHTVEVFLSRAAVTPPTGPGVELVRSRWPAFSLIPAGPIRRWLGRGKRAIEAHWRHLNHLGATPTVFHTTGNTPPPWAGLPSVVTIHDLIAEIFPEFSQLEHMVEMRAEKERAVRFADRFVAVSECTRRDLCRIYSIPESRVDVIHHGLDFEFFAQRLSPAEAQRQRSDWGIHRPYILYLGGRLHHKNFLALVEAFALSKLAVDYDLVVAGFPWEASEWERIQAWNLCGVVKHVGYVDRARLPLLLQQASVFVFPSLYEGFGMPLIEAMAAGCPVAASATGPFPEIAGGAAQLFDPRNPGAIAAAIEALLPAAVADEFRRKGEAQARRYSWDDCAAKHIECYLNAYSHNAVSKRGG